MVIRKLVENGQLKFFGTGWTTPDNTVIHPEALLRDYLYGQQWLKENGLYVDTRLVYLADNQGYTPRLPNIMQALGFEQVVISRIDGFYFPGLDGPADDHPADFPKPGSSAELLSKKLKTNDFLWKGNGDVKVQCHWNPFTYGHGDSLDTEGGVKWMSLRIGGKKNISESFIAERINQFAQSLNPLAITPYLLCVIGFDFNTPVNGLVDLLDRYNDKHFTETGIFAVNAGLDDYMDLVSHYVSGFPTLEFDPNPYWMGLYATRPNLKQSAHRLVEDLLAVESVIAHKPEPIKQLDGLFEEAWQAVCFSNHHDMITGTSTRRVTKYDQWRRLNRGLTAKRKIASILDLTPQREMPKPAYPDWELSDGLLRIRTPFYQLEMDESKGGCITLWEQPDGTPLLSVLGNDIVTYHDNGGLWRMGQEFRGGKFIETDRASQNPASFHVAEMPGGLEVEISSNLEGIPLTRYIYLRSDTPTIRFTVKGKWRDWRTVTTEFPTSIQSNTITMRVPGGIITRPRQKAHDPTFWSFYAFAHVKDDVQANGIALFMDVPATITFSQRGCLGCVVGRNPVQEQVEGLPPRTSYPATGPDRSEQTIDYAIRFTSRGDWKENNLHRATELEPIWFKRPTISQSILHTEPEGIEVMCLKPAASGEGIILRLDAISPVVSGVKVRVEGYDF